MGMPLGQSEGWNLGGKEVGPLPPSDSLGPMAPTSPMEAPHILDHPQRWGMAIPHAKVVVVLRGQLLR